MIHTMETDKPSKPNKRSSSSSSKLLKFLPKAATSAVSFQNPPPFSPGRQSDSNIHKRNVVYNSSSLDPNGNHHRTKSHAGKGFSGPLMASLVPAEARRRAKNDDGEVDFDTAEPASPKISCMGQIKKKKMKKCKAAADKAREKKRPPPPPKKQVSAFRRIFGGGKQRRAGEKSGGGKADDAASELAGLPDRAPALSQMRRFASGREAFAGFDWSEVADVDAEQRNCQSDDERDHWDEQEEEEEVLIPFSAPILIGAYGGGGVGGGVKVQPRKEINLWKRRTMAPPRPLRLHPADSDGKN